MNPSDFETRAREAATQYARKQIDDRTGKFPRVNPSAFVNEATHSKFGFEDGAQWSRTETIAEILGMLAEYREAYSEEIFPPQDMSQLDPKVRTVTAGYMGRHVLDTLMRQLKEGK